MTKEKPQKKMKGKIKRLKYLLKYINKRSNEEKNVKKEFDNLIEEIYGFHYSDVDLDWIIDAVDYGMFLISFEDFDSKMKQEKRG